MTFRTLLLAAGLTLAAAAVTPVMAQDTPAEPVAQTSIYTLPVTFDFNGGTIYEYIDTLQQAVQVQTTRSLNVVVLRNAADFRLPAIALRDVAVDAAVNVIDGINGSIPGGLVQVQVERIMAPGATDPVYRVDMAIQRSNARPGSRGGGTADRMGTGVWNVLDLLQNENAPTEGDLLTAIETALTLMESEYGECNIRFHQETGVIIARGDYEQINVIDEVVDAIREGFERVQSQRRQQQQQNAGRSPRTVTEIKQLEETIAEQRKMIEDLQAQLKKLQPASGGASHGR